MHVLSEFGRKVHYSAVFGDGKKKEIGCFDGDERKDKRIERRDAENAEKNREEPRIT
jgi:hypothetical protein